METLKDFFEEFYEGESEALATEHLYQYLCALDMLGAFRGGVWGPSDIMDNLEDK